MFCGRVKEFLSSKNVLFTEKDVTADPAALVELEKLGYMTTPVTLVDGKTVVGFDKRRLEEALSGSGRQHHLEAMTLDSPIDRAKAGIGPKFARHPVAE